ncbi:MarR family winged helix-turn-helix transcriptional regulator [Salinifilum ghardaiensis]
MEHVDLGDDPLKLDRQVCFALSVASRNVISIYRPLLAPLGLTHPQYLVMLALWERSPRSAKELSEILHAEPATLSPLLKRLETIGYVVRARGRRDERSLDVDLTETGAALRAEAEKIPYEVVELLGLDVAELEHLNEVLGRLITSSAQVLDEGHG